MFILPEVRDKMTVGEIIMYYRMHQMREARDWEKHRFVAYTVIKMHDAKNKISDPTQLLPLITDPSEEDMKELREQMKQEREEEIERILKLHREKGRNV